MIQDSDNLPYVTVLHGVGVFVAVMLTWMPASQEYKITSTSKSRKTEEAAKKDEERLATLYKVEVR